MLSFNKRMFHIPLQSGRLCTASSRRLADLWAFAHTDLRSQEGFAQTANIVCGSLICLFSSSLACSILASVFFAQTANEVCCLYPLSPEKETCCMLHRCTAFGFWPFSQESIPLYTRYQKTIFHKLENRFFDSFDSFLRKFNELSLETWRKLSDFRVWWSVFIQRLPCAVSICW